MADYPDWVLAHKKKGTYINCVKGKYYLYAAHSERIPGTQKVRRVSDGYIGRITEEDGLIPARDKVDGGVAVHEYGLCMALLTLCTDVAKGLQREFRGATEKVLVAGLLSAAYGGCSTEEYGWSYLSVMFPGLAIEDLTGKQRTGAERCTRMAMDTLSRKFGEAAGQAAAKLSRICAVKVNGRIYIQENIGDTKEWLLCHNVEWRELYGEGSRNDTFHQGVRTDKRLLPTIRRGRPKKTDT